MYPDLLQILLLMLCWCSAAGRIREHVTVVFVLKGCQYLINGCLQPIGTEITKDAKLKIVDTPLMLIFRMEQWPWCCHFWWKKLPTRCLCTTATTLLFNYHTYKTINRWCYFSEWGGDRVAVSSAYGSCWNLSYALQRLNQCWITVLTRAKIVDALLMLIWMYCAYIICCHQLEFHHDLCLLIVFQRNWD